MTPEQRDMPQGFEELRRRAEEELANELSRRQDFESKHSDELLQEMQIYHAELEIQNEELRRTQAELQESHRLYHDLYHFAPVGYLMVDQRGKITSLNLAAGELLGKPRRFAEGLTLPLLVAHQDHDKCMACLQHARETLRREQCEVRLRGNAEQPRHVQLEASAVAADGGGMLRITLTDITPLKAREAEVEELNATLERRVRDRTAELEQTTGRLRSLARKLVHAEQQERQRLSQDLHDYLAQLLVAASITLARLKQKAQEDERHGLLNELEMMLGKARDYTRTLITDLNPAVLRASGLTASFHHLGEQLSKLDLKVDVVCEEEDVQLPESQAALLYQCVRELLYNCLKHSETDRATLKLGKEDSELAVSVTDHGAGFDVDEVRNRAPEEDGFGLVSIEERMIAAGGRMHIDAAPGEGACITLYMELREEKEESEAFPPRENPPETDYSECDEISVLLVDDHPQVREGFRSMLEDYPHLKIVAEAGNGFEAIDAAREIQPDAVLIDLNMPEMGGIEAIAVLREEHEQLWIIAMSVEDAPEKQRLARDAGANAFLSKAIPPEDLAQFFCLPREG